MASSQALSIVIFIEYSRILSRRQRLPGLLPYQHLDSAQAWKLWWKIWWGGDLNLMPYLPGFLGVNPLMSLGAFSGSEGGSWCWTTWMQGPIQACARSFEVWKIGGIVTSFEKVALFRCLWCILQTHTCEFLCHSLWASLSLHTIYIYISLFH